MSQVEPTALDGRAARPSTEFRQLQHNPNIMPHGGALLNRNIFIRKS
jgi:hypothetical protein